MTWKFAQENKDLVCVSFRIPASERSRFQYLSSWVLLVSRRFTVVVFISCPSARISSNYFIKKRVSIAYDS